MSTMSLPISLGSKSLIDYMDVIRNIPSLEPQEEFDLAKEYVENNNLEAAHTLIKSHLKLVVKIAMGFRGYNLPLMDLVSEGNIGLMHAVRKFDPYKGFRLSTYAMWWIKANIQEYIIRSWSLVKIGTTAMQKKLFFNLCKLKRKIENVEGRRINHSDMSEIARQLGTDVAEITDMTSRISPDISLNNTIGSDESASELIELIPETKANQEVLLGNIQEYDYKKRLFSEAMNTLSERERDIIQSRHMQDSAATLDTLSKIYSVSRERIRQIEEAAMLKLQEYVKNKLLVAKNA